MRFELNQQATAVDFPEIFTMTLRTSGKQFTRRGFQWQALAGLGVPLVLSSSAKAVQKTAANDRITLGIIGLGSRAYNLIDAFLTHTDCRIVAVCDVDELHYRDREWGKGNAHGRKPGHDRVAKGYAKKKSGTPANGISVYADYRELLQHDDLDAVVVATPDHWHAKCTLDAIHAGKDVYCEKPVTHFFAEGQVIYREAELKQSIVQVGSQQRSTANFQQAVEIVMNGHLGKITEVEVGLPPGYEGPMGDPTVKSPPASVDYDSWCGPAPKLPYMRARHHRWWRGHRAFGGGVLMDWIGHHNDIAHWGLGMDKAGPTSVEAVDWTYPDTDIYNSPHEYEIQCQYPNDVKLTISTRLTDGTKFIGEDGWVWVNRGRLKASDERWLAPDFNRGTVRAYESESHTQNFLDCVKSRKECICPAETGHRSITPGHLGYVSDALGRPLEWDAVNEVVVSDPEANKLLQKMSYRDGWTLI